MVLIPPALHVQSSSIPDGPNLMFKLSALDRLVGVAGNLVVTMEPCIVGGLPRFDMRCEGLLVYFNFGIRNPHGSRTDPLMPIVRGDGE